jgi:hypothetical protein
MHTPEPALPNKILVIPLKDGHVEHSDPLHSILGLPMQPFESREVVDGAQHDPQYGMGCFALPRAPSSSLTPLDEGAIASSSPYRQLRFRAG